jgi:hypothetical protein
MIAALPLLALTACGGASGPQSAGTIAPPAGGGSGSGGTGGGVGGNTPTPTPSPAATQFLDVATETTFSAVGSLQSLKVTESGQFNVTGPLLYQGNASTVRAPTGSVTYNPRDGIFSIAFADDKAGVNQSVRFQDPAHRTQTTLWGVPDLAGFNYLEAVGPSARAATPGDLGRNDSITFFYQRPGAQTTYVSLAGYVRNAYEPTADPLVFNAASTSNFDRGAMVFGEQTLRSQIPVTGSASYSGGMLATMVVNTSANSSTPNYFQWITGTADITINFANATFTNLMLSGTVSPATYGGVQLPSNATGVPGGSTFNAVGAGTVDLTRTGGFSGKFSSVSFTPVNGGSAIPVYDAVNPANSVAGANSIDGTFFGPNAVNIGGNFRVVGGKPDERVDILGAFTGAKK